MSKDKEAASPSVDPNIVKGNEVARNVMGTGAAPEGFHVEFRDGVATLTGKLKSEQDRQRVMDAARAVGGVASIKDSMTTGAAGSGAEQATGGVGGGGTYTVQSGDTLTKIAKHYYGDASKFNRIFEANRNILSDADKIQVGQVLTIPE